MTLLRPRTGTLVSPEDRNHPAKHLLTEDAHYGYMQRVLFANASVTMIDATLCNLAGKDRRRRFRGAQICGGPLWQKQLKRSGLAAGMYPAEIYHNVKHPQRFEWFRARPQRLQPPAIGTARLQCDGGHLGKVMSGLAQACCRNWRQCRFVDGSVDSGTAI